MNSLNILDLPPEIIIEIFTYLPWFDFTEACLVCKLWLKIGQQHKFASKRCLSLTHCNLNDSTEPGTTLINTIFDYHRVVIGKSCYVTRNSDNLFERIGQTVTEVAFIGNLEWEHGLLYNVLEKLPALNRIEIGLGLADEVNSKKFVEILLTRKFKEVTLHGLTETFVEHFLNMTKDQTIDTLSSSFPNKQLLELTVPFKLRALPMLSTIPLDFNHLRKLEITSPKSFEDLKKVCQIIPKLQELVLWRGCLDFQLFDVFDYLINLNTLRIQSGLRFMGSSDFCENLQPKPKMKVLDMELIEGQINVDGFERLIKAMSNLTHLTLNQSEIRDEHVKIICDNLSKLKVLELDCNKVTDIGMLDANWKSLRKLQSLKLDGGYKITNDGFSNFVKVDFTELKELKLNYFTKIDHVTVNKISEACPFIEYLSLDGCSEINDSSIEIIALKLKRLRQLDLYSCNKVTTEAMHYLIRNCNRLQFLDVSALNIDEADKQELFDKIPSLKYVYDYDDGIDKSKYFKGKALRKRELYCTAIF